jgi:ATP-dependent exoDNAse (exonuclease V) alpha subunit
MISKKLMRQIEEAAPLHASILFVGDREQLEPVVERGEEAGWGVNFQHPDAVLTEIMRQAQGNPIVQLATAIRNEEQGRQFFAWHTDENDVRLTIQNTRALTVPSNKYVEYRRARGPTGDGDPVKNDVVMVTYTNGTRQKLNELARVGTGRAAVADRDGTYLAQADRVVVLMNNKVRELYNGEIFPVRSVEFMDREARAFGLIRVTLITPRGDEVVFLRGQALGMPPQVFNAAYEALRDRFSEAAELLAARMNFNGDPYKMLNYVPSEVLWSTVRTVRPVDLVQLDYGECITINKSQGSQWRNVVLVWDNNCDAIYDRQGPDMARRYAYTALTRASENANIFRVDTWGGRDRFEGLKKGYDPVPDWVFDPLPPLRRGDIDRLRDAAQDAFERARAENAARPRRGPR